MTVAKPHQPRIDSANSFPRIKAQRRTRYFDPPGAYTQQSSNRKNYVPDTTSSRVDNNFGEPTEALPVNVENGAANEMLQADVVIAFDRITKCMWRGSQFQ